MPKKRFDNSTTRDDIQSILGGAPGYLGNTALNATQRTALKYYLRRWGKASALDVQKPIHELRNMYDALELGTQKEHEPSQNYYDYEQPENTEGTPEIPDYKNMPEYKPPTGDQDISNEISTKKSTPDTQKALDLATALKNAMGDTLDEARVRDICIEVIEKVKDSLPAREIKIIYKENKQIEVEGLTHKIFDRVVRLIGVKQDSFIYGPSGTGKSHVVKQAADALSIDFASISCSEGLSESKILGWLIPIGDSGKFEYVESDFIRIYENGGVFLFDEMDSSDANTLTVLNQALANGGFYLPQRVGNTFVKRHENFICFCAANTPGHGGDVMYVGRNRLDAATLDRFRMGFTEMDYDKKLEAKLGHPVIIEWAGTVRKMIASHKLRHVMSTRTIVKASQQIEAGFEMPEIKKSYFSDWSKDERSKVGV